jgi:hypothetical protein
MMEKERRWFGGIDWGSQEHVVTLCDSAGKKIGQRKFSHGGAGLTDMIACLLKASGGEPGEIHVAIETPHGPIVEALLERGFSVYSINPKKLDRFRDRFTVAGAKDDSRDADVLADCLRTDTRAFRKLSIADPVIVELREWSRIDEELKVEHGRLTNSISISSGATIHRCWSSLTTSARTSSLICSRLYLRPRKLPVCVKRPSHGYSRAIASAVSMRPMS